MRYSSSSIYIKYRQPNEISVFSRQYSRIECRFFVVVFPDIVRKPSVAIRRKAQLSVSILIVATIDSIVLQTGLPVRFYVCVKEHLSTCNTVDYSPSPAIRVRGA